MRPGYRALLCLLTVSIVNTSLLTGCASRKSGTNSTANTSTATTPELPYATAPLPDSGYKATITLPDPPSKLRAGEKVIIQVKAKNASDVSWKVRGGGVDNKFYIAAGNRWLKPDGSLITAMDGRHGLDKNLKPGEETEVPLQITAPKDPGDYILEVDLVQEQVAWFLDKGSPTAKTKITVVR